MDVDAPQNHMSPIPDRLKKFGAPSVWLEFSPLAQREKAVNLGQGFPGWNPPTFVTEIAKDMVGDTRYAQYARSAGVPLLAQAVSNHYEHRLKQKINWQDETVVTVGCSEAILLAFFALVNPGDEVVFIDPAFDIYRASLAMIGGKSVSVPMIFKNREFNIDFDLLARSITSRTKAIVLNTPHNPTGKVLSRDELSEIVSILRRHPQVVVISDEVYEHLVFGKGHHESIASIPEIAGRTVSLFSAGKTFSITGWKIGWAIGPKDLIKRMQICQQWIVFSVATPLQAAVAHCLDQGTKPYRGKTSYYEWLKDDYDLKRQTLLESLKKAGLDPLMPQGSFFISVPLDSLPTKFSATLPEGYLEKAQSDGIAVDASTLGQKDYNFCRSLTINHKVAAIPYSAFYDHPQGLNMARFAFCKPLDALKEAGQNLDTP